MGKIKVLHRAATTGIGGVESYVMNYYKYIDKSKFQFDFLTRNEKLEDSKQVKELGMGVRTFTATEIGNRDLLIKQINDILDEGYEIIHMNTSYWVGFLIEEIAMERGIPKVIVHAHSSGIDQKDNEKRRLAIETHNYYKSQFGRCHATDFLACSRAAADWLYGPQIPYQEICILKNAIEVDRYSYHQDKRMELRKELDLDGKFLIGHIGRFAYQKNHRFLIDVFWEFHKKMPASTLMLIGEGELEAEIKAQIKEYGLEESVLQMGWRDDVGDLMQAMDVFLLPSWFEGLPVVLVEAQAAGLRCIASDLVTREVAITENIRFLPLDTSTWTEELAGLACGYERKDMEQAISLAGFNIKNAAKELEKIYLS